MPSYTDQTGREIHLAGIPTKIVSTVPSQTELLHYFGLEEEVIAITKFCIHPSIWFAEKLKVGGTKNLNLDLIRSLSPDLIISNKEENTREQIEELCQHYPVWVSDISDLGDACNMIARLGEITGKIEIAELLVNKIQKNFKSLTIPEETVRAAYLIWQKPYMVAGGDTFIDSMLQYAGYDNVFKDRLRYPTVSIGEIKNKKPATILLSSEPFPFKEKHVLDFRDMLPESKVRVVDGEMFSWYGSRLLQTPGYFELLKIDG